MRTTRKPGLLARIPILSLALFALSAVGSTSAGVQDPAQKPRVSLAFDDTDIRDALRLVARQCGVNIVISNEVQGTITLELESTSLVETLDAIVAVGGFRYSVQGSIVTVQTYDEVIARRKQRADLAEPDPEPAPYDPQTLILNLRYIDAERVQPIVESLLGEGGRVALLKTSDHVAKERPGGRSGSEEGLQIGTRLTTSSIGEPAKSHTLVVVDDPEHLARIEQVVQRLDVKPPQVVIEARFVEISLDDEQRLGIDWNVLAAVNGASAPHTAPFGNSSLGSFDPHVEGGSPGGVFPPAPNNVSTPSQPGLFTFGTLDFTTFSAVLEMIHEETDTRTVSNPRVVVRDRHTATILVGERYPILSANVSEFGTVTEELDHYEPVGVQLAVTPSVLGEEVELLVRPSTSTLGADVEGTTGLGVARINSRQIDTLVTVADGQTVVIGGLITSRDVDTENRVPYLGALPLLGGLFRYESSSTERVDLVIFLTVSIVQENGLTADQRRLFEESTLDRPAVPPADQMGELEFVPSPPQY